MSEHSKHIKKQAHQRHEEKVALNKPHQESHEEVQDIEFVEHIVPRVPGGMKS